MHAKIALAAGSDRQARVDLDRAEDYLRSGLAGDHPFLAGLAGDRAMEMANRGTARGIDQLLVGGAFPTGDTPPGASLNSTVVNMSQCAGPEAMIAASQAKAFEEAGRGSGQLAFHYAAGAAWFAANSFGDRSATALRAQLLALEMQLEYGDLPPDLRIARGPLQLSALGGAIQPPMKLTTLTANPSQVRAAIETARDALAKDDPGRALAARALARALLLLGQAGEAQARAEEAISLARAAYGAGHPEVAKAQLVEADGAAALHNPVAAQDALVAALTSFEAAYGASAPNVNQALIDLAGLFSDTDRAPLGLQILLRLRPGPPRDDELNEPLMRLELARLRLMASTGNWPGIAEEAEHFVTLSKASKTGPLPFAEHIQLLLAQAWLALGEGQKAADTGMASEISFGFFNGGGANDPLTAASRRVEGEAALMQKQPSQALRYLATAWAVD
jgi:hypothetical protein